MVIKAVKICLAPTSARAAMALKAMEKAVWILMNVRPISAVSLQLVITPWGHTGADATMVTEEMD